MRPCGRPMYELAVSYQDARLWRSSFHMVWWQQQMRMMRATLIHPFSIKQKKEDIKRLTLKKIISSGAFTSLFTTTSDVPGPPLAIVAAAEILGAEQAICYVNKTDKLSPHRCMRVYWCGMA
ncbi:hypothetical protein JOB18_016745 [Solea senegalensis]|uniref:Uncharacterized protein n=1 Tax=Solea senegalensis TaxID=28829 RepID=A0AAV6R780_SOLSE|nr:hypothetical protein JOB18_016745 [Solea senegalensis]